MKELRQALIVFNLKTLIISLLAILATYICLRLEIFADFPLVLVATAVVFPIVFSINSAYKRREVALAKYSSLKANGLAIYYASRDWVEDTGSEDQAKAKNLLGALLIASRTLFTRPDTEMRANEKEVYRLLSQLSVFINEDLRRKGMPSGEVSRCNVFLSRMLVAFEDMKHIYQYRTPRSLRAFSDVFVAVLPILYAPYFAAVGQDFAAGLAYVTPVVFTTVLVSLDNIQGHLENPFDQIGADDITINAEKFVGRLELT